jgi:FeS assembly SUF system protein
MAGKLPLPESALIRPGRANEDDSDMEEMDEKANEQQGSKQGAGAATAESSKAGEKLSREKLEEMVIDAMRTVYDPEIPVNIYDLGLVYDMRVEDDGKVVIKMTLTTPMCPVAGSMPGMVEQAVRLVHAVTDCEVELVWDPAWNPDMMTEAARLQLNI